MNPAQLLSHFDRISEAPDAIPLLRRFILGLAVRGKLVQQNPNDEPVSIVDIPCSNQSHDRGMPESLGDDTWPNDLPESWRWYRLGAVSQRITDGEHATPPRIMEQQVPLVTAKNVRNGFMDYGDTDWVSFETANKAWARCRPAVGDVLLVCVGATTGRLCVLRDARDMVLVRSVALVRPNSAVNVDYLALTLRSPMCQAQMWAKVKMTAQPCLYINRIKSLPIPLPPLEEQQRIVAKVDELMALCDRLEAAQAERESRRDRLAAASLHRLNNGADAEAFRNHARFYFNQLPRLTTRTEHIQQLRQAILSLAVRGKLVPQDPNDEPVSELLKRLRAEESDNGPFLIPISWVWVSVDQIGDSRLGKMLDNAKNKGTPRRYLRNVNVRWFDFDLSDVFQMRFEDAELDEFALRNGDVLICEGGEPGRAAVWDERESNIYFQKAIHRVRFSEGVAPRFFVNALRQSADSGRLSGYFTGVGIKHFTGKGLSSFVFPLPPVAEQHRIVAKVDELMALCNRLEAQLTITQTESRRLLDAILHLTLRQVPNTDVSRARHSSQRMAGAHTSTATTGRPNKHFARTLLSAEIVHQLHAEPTFGRTKHQKILHLCEHIAQIEEVSGEYYRQVAGPLDNRLIYSVETELKKQQWYEEYRRPEYGHGYRPLEKAGGHLKYLERYWPDKLSVIRRLVDIMRTWDTDHCEIFATVYAAWNDLLIWKQEPSDEAILEEVLGRWHESKKRFSEARWQAMVAWIRKERFIPVGFGRPTKQLVRS